MFPPTLPATARSRLALSSFGVTDVGRKREHNEDAFSISEEYELFVLADGMGGHASGEVASNLTVNHIIEFFTRTCRAPDFVWPYSTPGLRTFEERAVSNSIQFANDRVFVESMKDRRYDGMGTTICVLAGAGDHLVLGHVGDSRIYRFRAGKLEQLTEDHSLINLYRRTRNVSEEELQAFGKKNVIVRAVGLKDYVEPDLQVVDRVPGDIFLMCSDGLSEMVDDWIIREVIMGDSDNLQEIGKTLVRLANQNGGKDNITVVLVRVADGPKGGLDDFPTDVSLPRQSLPGDTHGPDERAITEITAMPPIPPPIPPAAPTSSKELDPFVPLMLSAEAIAEITGQRSTGRTKPNEARGEARDVLRRTAPASPVARVGSSRVGVELISGEVAFESAASAPSPPTPTTQGVPDQPAPPGGVAPGASQRRALLRDTRPIVEESRTPKEPKVSAPLSAKATSSYVTPDASAPASPPVSSGKTSPDGGAVSDGFQTLRDELHDTHDDPFPVEDPDLRVIVRNSKVAPLPPLPRR